MEILLDTHALWWSLTAPEQLAPEAAAAIRDPRNVVNFSPASIWELEFKAARGKLVLPRNWTDALGPSGFLELPIRTAQVVEAARLPAHHHDPFDRLLIAQARLGNLRLASRDAIFSQYDVTLLPA